MFRRNHFMTVFSKIQNWPPKHFNMLFFSSNPGPNFTLSSNRLDTGEKLIIFSYQGRLDMSLHFTNQAPYPNIYVKSGFFTSILVVRNAVF